LETRAYEQTEFLLDPYIPRQGTVFLYGDSSIGKSPLTWSIARHVAAGSAFCGLPTSVGKVLYIEVDTPERIVVPRLQRLHPIIGDEWKGNLHWVFDENLTVPSIPTAKCQTTDRLLQFQEVIEPDLVIVNTCRKIHTFDDKDSKTPSAVYNYFKMVFPQAATLFVHHERKRSRDPEAHDIAQESFSGSKAWMNDAQVGLHLVSHRPKHGKSNLRLLHWKSQVSEKMRGLELQLEDDGTNIHSHVHREFIEVFTAINLPNGPKGRDLDAEVAKKLNTSDRTIRARRRAIQDGLWPGSREWLGRADRPAQMEEGEGGDEGE
jgi:hypothetical protein